MKKTFKLANLGCANCAAKMEDAIKKIGGVEDARVSFLTQSLTLEAPAEAFDALLPRIASLCKRVEPDCKLSF